MASYSGDLVQVRRLLGEGVNVNFQFEDGSTALIAAACNGHSDVTSYLLEKHADPTVSNDNGQTAYTVAKDSTIQTCIKSALARWKGR